MDIKKMDLEDLKAEVYRREMITEEKETDLLTKKNERRRSKLLEGCGVDDTGNCFLFVVCTYQN